MGAPRIKYLTELQATAFDFGLIAGIGAFALSFQLVGSVISNRLSRRKPVWMVVAILHRLLYAGLLAAPFLFTDSKHRLWWIIAFVLLHDALAHVSVPLWLSWMADLVPRNSMSLHWARRQKFITAANTVFMVLVAFGFDYFEKNGQVILGYNLLAIAGIILGVADIVMFAGVPEPPHEPLRGGRFVETLVQPLKDPQFRPFLVFMAYWHFTIFLAAPFFGVFMIEELKMSVKTVQLLGVAGALGVVVASNYWGLLCDTFGFRRTMEIIAFGKIFAPLIFVLTPPDPRFGIPFLAVMMFVDGLLNAGMTLAPQGVMLKSTPKRNRTMYIAVVNFLSVGTMAAIAPILAGKIIDLLNHLGSVGFGPYRFGGYHWVFLASVVLRFGSVPLARRIHETKEISLDAVLREIRSLKSYRAAGLILRLQESPRESVRLRSARRLGELQSPLAINPLVESLQDPSTSVRNAAANSLGRIGMADAAEPLARALFDRDSGIHARAARALGRIGGPDSLRALLQNLRHGDPRVLRVTVDSLGRIGDAAAMVPLICLFHDYEDSALRERIAKALGRISTTESTDEVLAALTGLSRKV
jgi:MFS family permease